MLSIRKGDISPLHAMWGNVFENMVVSELTKQNHHSGLLRDYYFWRDSKGHEVDLLYEKGQSLTVYEIKSSSTVQEKMFSELKYFEGISGDQVTDQFLIYGGDKEQKRTDYHVLPWSKVR